MNKNTRLVVGPKERKQDSINRRVILSMIVDKESEQMNKIIKYFDDWVAWYRIQKDSLTTYGDLSRCDQLGVSTISLRNLKTSVFFYARDILSDQRYDLKYVPFLHNNSSTLESAFSCLRANMRDTATLLNLASFPLITKLQKNFIIKILL